VPKPKVGPQRPILETGRVKAHHLLPLTGCIGLQRRCRMHERRHDTLLAGGRKTTPLLSQLTRAQDALAVLARDPGHFAAAT
jgi:hypothetical protein